MYNKWFTFRSSSLGKQLLLEKLKTTLASPDRVKRGTHFIYGEILHRIPLKIRERLYAGEEYFCPICENSLKCFLPLYRPYHAWCPICWSLQRHRLAWLFFHKNTDLFNQTPKKMLHIAPEDALASRLKLISKLDYLSIDLNDGFAMLKMDVMDMKFPDDHFDVIYCSHVLEHVHNDMKAIQEMYRVTKPGGWAAIMVPITAESTIEDLSINDPRERERLFGQYDHVRKYGLDISNRLEAGRFRVSVLKARDLVNQGDIHKLGLLEFDRIFYCLK